MLSLTSQPFLSLTDISSKKRYKPNKKKTSSSGCVWQKICEFIKKIWNTITSWFKRSPFSYDRRQVEFLREWRQSRRLDSQRVSQLQSSDEPQNRPSASETEIFQKPTPPTDPVLNDLSDFLTDFSRVAVNDCLLEEKILPRTEETKESLLGFLDPESIKKIADLKKAINPIMKSLEESGMTTLMRELFQAVLQVLLQGDENVNIIQQKIKEVLTTNIDTLLEQGQIDQAKHARITSHIPKQSNNWLIHSPHPQQLHNLLLDTFTFLNTFTEMLSDGELDDPLHHIREQISTTWEEDIKILLEENIGTMVNGEKKVGPISEFISHRLMELLDNLPWTSTYNILLKALLGQTEGWIVAEKERTETEKTLEKNKKTSKAKPNDSKQVEKKNEMREAMNELNPDKHLEEKFHEAFSKHPGCHSTTRKAIEAENEKDEKRIYLNFYSELVRKIFKHIFPPQEISLPSGAIVEIDGIVRVLYQMKLPPNLEKIIHCGHDIVEQVLNRGEYKNKDSFKEYLFTLGKIIGIELLQNKIKEKIAKSLFHLFEKLSKKEYLDEFLATVILPIGLDKLFEGFTRTTMFYKLSEICTRFHQFITADKNNGDKIRQELLDTLYKMMKNRVVEFSLEEAGIDKEKFDKLIKPLIDDIEKKALIPLKNASTQTISEDQVKKALKSYLDPDCVVDNPDYKKIITNTFFNIGNYQSFSTSCFWWFVEPIISESANVALQDISSSHHAIISSLLETSNETFLDPVNLTTMFFPTKDEQKTTNEKIQELLQTYIQRTSALTYDSLYHAGTFFTRPFLPSKDDISELVNSIYGKLIKRPIINKNLIFQILCILESGIGQSVDNLNTRRVEPLQT